MNETEVKTEKSMDDTMRETMAGIKARDTEAVADVSVKQSEETSTESTELPTDAKPPEGRDDKGRFAPKDKDAKITAPPEAPKDTVDPAKEGEAPKPEEVVIPPKAASLAPSSWSPAAKAKWDNLDPTIRAEVLKRESDAQRGIQQYAEKAKRLDAIDAVVQPQHKQQLTGYYGSFERGLQELLALNDFAGKSPYDFVAYFAQQRSLDPQQLLQILQRGAPQGQQQPTVAAPQADNPYEKRLTALEQQNLQLRNQSIEGTINSFKNQTDDAGNPVHPHFDELRSEVAAFLDMGKNLQEAYDMAVWASPAHREQILHSQNEAARLKAEADQKVKAEAAEKQAKEARQAAVAASVTRPNAGATPTQATSWEDTLKKNQMRLMGTA